jgi:protocatechuate 3,4-dioxygenase beta subunit
MGSIGEQSKGRRAVLEGGAALVGSTLVGWSGVTAASAAEGTGAGPGGRAGAGGAAGVAQSTTLTAADFAPLGPCQLTPEQTQGPFYSDLDLMRRDITETLAGHRLRLGLQVVDEANDCQPIPDAVVDVWHCDVDGDYSAFLDGTPGDGGPGTTFLRGSQVTNQEGIVEFHTNYPGWYTGRAVHIHIMVHVGGSRALTTQLYLPDELTDQVHTEAPYAAHGQRTIRNGDDLIAGNPEANGTLLATTPEANGTLGLGVLGVAERQACTFWEWLWYLLTGQGSRCA